MHLVAMALCRVLVFDDQCSDLEFYEHEALRYYANIVALFPRPVLKAIEKLKDVPVNIVAPSHGLIWRGNPGHIIELYKKWANYAIEGPETRCNFGIWYDVW